MAKSARSQLSINVGLHFEEAGNSLQKILSNFKAGFTNGKNGIFGKDVEKNVTNYQQKLQALADFKLKADNVTQFNKAVRELEASWDQLVHSLNQTIQRQDIVTEDQVNDAKAKLERLKKVFFDTIGLEFDQVYASDGKNSKGEHKRGDLKEGVVASDKYNRETAAELRKNISDQVTLVNKLTTSYNEAGKAQEQVEKVEKLLVTTGQQHQAVLEGQADAQNNFSNALRSADLQDFQDKLTRHIQSFGALIFSINGVRNAFNKMKATYQEVDKSITAISMVSGISRDDLWKDVGRYNEMARELGSTTTEALEASKVFYQQGLETNDVLILTEQSLKLAAIAETDTANATKYLTTAINGFKLTAQDTEMVMDSWAELAGRTAVEVEDIATAISKVASIAQSAGMELQSTSAFLTQIMNTTREAPETAGTALKTIIARFQELKKSGAALEDGVDANKVEAALKTANVALRDSAGQFRDFDEVILELSSKWDTLDRNTQRYIATIAAGSRQQSRFIALVDDYDGLLQNMEYAYDSAGAASQQFSTYNEGLSASLNRVKAAWESVYLSFEKGETLISGTMDLVAKLLEVLAQVPANFGIIGTLLAGTVGKIGLNAMSGAMKGLKWSEQGGLLQLLIYGSGTPDAVTGKILRSTTDLGTGFSAIGKAITNIGKNLATFLAPVAPYLIATAAVLAALAAIKWLNDWPAKRLENQAKESAKLAQEARSLADTYSDYSDRLAKVATGEEDLESIRRDLINQFGPYYDGLNLLTAGYTDLKEAMDDAAEEQDRLAIAGDIVEARDARAQKIYEARRDWLDSDAGKQFKSDIIAEEGAKIQKVVVGFVTKYEYNGEHYDTEDEAEEAVKSTAAAQAAAYAQSYAESLYAEKEVISQAQAEILAEGIDGWADMVEAEQQAVIRAIQEGSLEIGTKTKGWGKNKKITGVTYDQETLNDVVEFTKTLNGLTLGEARTLGFDATEVAEFQTAVQDLLDGAITWDQFLALDEGYAEALRDMGNYGAELANEFEKGAEAQRNRIRDSALAAGLAYDETHNSYGTAATKLTGGLGLSLASILNSKDLSSDIKEIVIQGFNGLEGDRMAQFAFVNAVNGLIASAEGDLSKLSASMFNALLDPAQAESAFAEMFLLGDARTDVQDAFFTSLKKVMEDTAESGVLVDTVLQKIGSTIKDIEKLSESMSLGDFISMSAEMGAQLETLGLAAEGAGAAMWLANMAVEEGSGEVKINTSLQEAMAEAMLKNAINTTQAALSQAQENTQLARGAIEAASARPAFNGLYAALNELDDKKTNGAKLWEIYWKYANDKISASEAQTLLAQYGTTLDEVSSTIDTFISQQTDDFQDEWNNYNELLNAERSLKASLDYLKGLSAKDLLKGKGGSKSNTKSEIERQRELLEKQKEILEAEGDAQEKRIKLIQEELKARKEALKEEQDAIKDAFEQQQEQWEIRLEYVRDALEAEREALEEAADAAEDAAQKEIDAAKRAAEGKINLIRMQIDAMDEEADAENRLLELQKARDAYERARTSKTRLVLTKGAGWIFKTDNAQVEDAAANLKDVERDYQKSLLEAQIAEIEKVVESMEDVEGLLGMTADEIAAMNEATKKWSDYIINGTFADEVATQIGTSIVDPETGVKQTSAAGIAQAAIDASQAVADWAEKFEPVLEALEAAIEKIGTSMEDMLLNTEAEEKELDDFFNQIVGAGGTNEILSALDGTMVEVEASQRGMAEKSASIDETIKKIDEDLEAWDEQLDLIGLSSSEIAETQKQVAEYQAATLEELGVHGKYYEEIAATLKDLAEKWEQYNIADRDLKAREEAEEGYSSGGVASFTGRAKLHGSASRPEVVLNNSQAAALFNWVNGLGSNRYDTIFDSLGQQVSLLEHQMRLLNAGTALVNAGHGDTYNFGTVNIDSDANSIEQLVTDIRRLSPLTQHR